MNENDCVGSHARGFFAQMGKAISLIAFQLKSRPRIPIFFMGLNAKAFPFRVLPIAALVICASRACGQIHGPQAADYVMLADKTEIFRA